MHIKCKYHIKLAISLFLLLGLLFGTTAGCSGQKGLIAEEYSSDFYRVPKLLPDGPIDKNPGFIVYGDSQPGWRFKEKFLNKKNWLTWKMLLVPFYEVYWLGNGAVGGVNYFRNKPDYGDRERLMVRDAIYSQAKQSAANFVLHLGDVTDDGMQTLGWAKFLKENKVDLPLVLDFPFLPVIGNHEKANDVKYGFTNYQAIFEYPRFYVLDFPDAAIFVLDSNIILDQYQLIDDDEQDALFHKWFISEEGSQKPSWLEKELSSRKQRFKIIAMHQPPVSFARHHTDWVNSSYGNDLPKKRQQILKLFRENGVQAVFSGHEHIYEHSIVRSPSYGDVDESEIHIIISSGGGVPIRPRGKAQKLEKFHQNYRSEGLDVVMIKQENIYHYCFVDIASSKITIKVMEVTGESAQPVRLADEILLK